MNKSNDEQLDVLDSAILQEQKPQSISQSNKSLHFKHLYIEI